MESAAPTTSNVVLLALQADELDVVSLGLVDVDKNVSVLGIVIALGIDGGLELRTGGSESGHLDVVVLSDVTALIGLFLDNLVNLSKIGVDDDQTVAVLDLIELDLLCPERRP